ncbi:hypothetical protein OIU77_022846 [Salix suchowensis]|uniref:alpha,alpha-trehalase n=1 Tax=Salix suchowensis TaxID=1278906 RepID=A0ABQ9C5D2_9ROSI|nr:hypothetical protein OIU77_022846 [Salix suchowensis]
MHEKYDVQKCGESGGGGEYIPQTGFGWSNGVLLAFLEEFGWPEDRSIDDPPIPRKAKVGTKLLKELYRGSKF